jgi:hypothetical protein
MVAIATSYTTHPFSPTWSSAGRLRSTSNHSTSNHPSALLVSEESGQAPKRYLVQNATVTINPR